MSGAQSNPVVGVAGVGASAGGLEAFRALLPALPTDTGLAFVLVQHLAPNQESLLTELLAPCTTMPVASASQDTLLRPDTIYIIQPDTAIAIRDGRLVITAPHVERGIRLPVDHLFRSLAADFGPRAAGIVLSGSGRDGSEGLRAIKEAGGLTIAQRPESGGQSGMPQASIDTGLVDFVLEIDQIAGALTRFAAMARPGSAEGPASTETESEHDPIDLTTVAAILDAHMSFNLRVYKPATVRRRIERRIGLSGFETFENYVARLRTDPDERQTLVRDLLIAVTGFFRDPEAFATLREHVLVPHVASLGHGGTMRVWVPGCATGEEAYSLAIEIQEVIEATGKPISLQMFATDINAASLAVARAGRYPASIAERMSDDRLQTHFKALDHDGYVLRSPIRNHVSFAQHDLTSDPPFSRMDLVSCRNVLIYLTPETQGRVLDSLHFALAPGGHLMLSTSESLGSRSDRFATVSKPQRIFVKQGTSRAGDYVAHAARRTRPASDADARSPLAGKAEHDVARRAIIDAWVPPTVVVSNDDAVLFVHGELAPYLRFPQGEQPRLELGPLLRPGLATRARGAVFRCRRERAPVVVTSGLDAPVQARITVHPMPSLGDAAVMLTFEPPPPTADADRAGADAGDFGGVADATDHTRALQTLDAELQATREDLHNTVEELETSNEELRSANEEARSVNEELQSANEELEATSEELRSLNEELITVNQQLREKVGQLQTAHDDIHNFLRSAKIATLFLDHDLCLKRHTPTAETLLRLGHRDTGRPLGSLERAMLHGLESDARAVLEDLTVRVCEIESDDGAWFIRRVLPYRTESRRIEGVVVTFLDISEARAAAQRVRLQQQQASVVARLGLLSLRPGGLQEFLDHVTREVQQTLQADFTKVLELQPGGASMLLRSGVGWTPGLVDTATVHAGTESQAGFTLSSAEVVIVEDLATERRFRGPALLTDHGVVSGMSCVIGEGERVYGVLAAHTTTRRTFSREDADFLQAVANIVGSAIGQRQAALRQAIELSVAHVLAGATGLDEALPRLLEGVADALGGALAEAWWPSKDGTHLTCLARHVARPPDETEETTRRWATLLSTEEGEVGRAFRSGRAIWSTDLVDESMFSRRDLARDLRLVSGLAIPVRVGERTVGVLTVFSRRRLVADVGFLRSLEAVGRAIGEFARRTELEHRTRQLAAFTEASHDAILSYDANGTITAWLPGAERLFGFTAEEMIGSSIRRIVPEDRHAELSDTNARIEAGEVVGALHTTRLHKDGRLLDVSVLCSPLRDADGRFIGVASTDRDMSEQKAAERALREADRQKDEFLAMLGHELRNPLAAIRGATELLRLGDPTPKREAELHAALDRQTRHLGKLLDGLLDASRIIQGRVSVEKTTVDLTGVCEHALSDARQRSSARQLELHAELPKAPLWVDADPVRLAQVLDNLLSNAVKYTTDGGHVMVRLERDGSQAVLRVTDTGVGIEPELLPFVFELFRQSEQSLDRSAGGLGIGLALVRLLVELHDGTVEAHSEGSDRGAEIVVRLPLVDGPAERVAPSPEPEQAPHFGILLIEDNEVVLEMLGELLSARGHRVATATAGQEGLARAREVRPDVVVCDLGLPGGMSGFEVARRLRSEPGLGSVRLVALSGYGRPEDKAKALDAGFEVHLTKPVDVDVLERALR